MFRLIKMHKVVNFFNQIGAMSVVVDFESEASILSKFAWCAPFLWHGPLARVDQNA
jgi:hypothetical protein